MASNLFYNAFEIRYTYLHSSMIAAHEVIREGVPDSEEKGIDRIKNDDYFSSIIKTFALYKFHVLKQLKPIAAYLS